MELTQIKEKSEYNEDVKKLMNIFTFDNIKPILRGSYGLSIIDYYADYDFWVIIQNRNYSTKEIYDEFKKILRQILNNNDVYFLEFKTQNLKGYKYKWLPNENFDYEEFNKNFNENKEYCKIDVVLWSENKFIESSVNYWFSLENKKPEIEKKEFKEAIKQLKKEGNYYKVLKKIYSLEVLKENKMDKILINNLINIFNSDLGKIYKDINNIDAIEKVKEYYGDEPLTKKRIELNLNEIKYYENYKQLYNKNKKYLNEEAKKLYNKL